MRRIKMKCLSDKESAITVRAKKMSFHFSNAQISNHCNNEVGFYLIVVTCCILNVDFSFTGH